MEQKQYYSVDEIKEKFNALRDQEDMWITDNEYNIFCTALAVLPIDIIDKIQNEVFFAILSWGDRINNVNPACHFNLSSKCLNNKKGIIFISSMFFTEKIKDIEIDDFLRARTIAHEVAHHILGHTSTKNANKRAQAEKEADELAREWMSKYCKNL